MGKKRSTKQQYNKKAYELEQSFDTWMEKHKQEKKQAPVLCFRKYVKLAIFRHLDSIYGIYEATDFCVLHPTGVVTTSELSLPWNIGYPDFTQPSSDEVAPVWVSDHMRESIDSMLGSQNIFYSLTVNRLRDSNTLDEKDEMTHRMFFSLNRSPRLRDKFEFDEEPSSDNKLCKRIDFYARFAIHGANEREYTCVHQARDETDDFIYSDVHGQRFFSWVCPTMRQWDLFKRVSSMRVIPATRRERPADVAQTSSYQFEESALVTVETGIDQSKTTFNSRTKSLKLNMLNIQTLQSVDQTDNQPPHQAENQSRHQAAHQIDNLTVLEADYETVQVVYEEGCQPLCAIKVRENQTVQVVHQEDTLIIFVHEGADQLVQPLHEAENQSIHEGDDVLLQPASSTFDTNLHSLSPSSQPETAPAPVLQESESPTPSVSEMQQTHMPTSTAESESAVCPDSHRQTPSHLQSESIPTTCTADSKPSTSRDGMVDSQPSSLAVSSLTSETDSRPSSSSSLPSSTVSEAVAALQTVTQKLQAQVASSKASIETLQTELSS